MSIEPAGEDKWCVQQYNLRVADWLVMEPTRTFYQATSLCLWLTERNPSVGFRVRPYKTLILDKHEVNDENED